MSRKPRIGMVVRGSGQSSSNGLHSGTSSVSSRVLMTQRIWSMLPLGWHDSQEKVPLLEARPAMNIVRPWRITSGVGSSPTSKVPTTSGSEGSRTSTTETLLSTVLRT